MIRRYMRTYLQLVIGLMLLVTVQNSQAQDDQYKVSIIGFYNFENLFDTINDPIKRDGGINQYDDRGWLTNKLEGHLNGGA